MPFTNPIIPGSYPDPSVCRVDDNYYLVTSSFEYFPGVPLFHSKDLVHWRQIGYCLTRSSQVPLAGVKYSDGIYAPTIRYHNGVFYVTATNATRGGHFVVHTRDPFGEWSEPHWVAQCGIDPSLLFDDGTVYFTSTNTGIDVDGELEVWPQTCAIVQSVIDLDTGKRLGPARPIWQGTGGKFPEGPHLYKIDGWYYLLIAEGGTEHGHTVVIARSRSPWGAWESCPHNPILTHRSYNSPIHATGHGDLIQAHNGSWWIVFLGIRPHGYGPVHHLGRETFLAPVTWNNDGWPVVNNSGKVTLQMTASTLPEHPWPAEPMRDDFDAPTLRPCWNFLRNPYPEDWSLGERPGSLRLHGSSVTLADQNSPAFIGRRQQHFVCTIATLLDFEPQHGGEEAGLTVRMNEEHHYEIAVTRRGNARCVFVRRQIGSLCAEVACAPLDQGLVRLRIRATHAMYTFSYALGDGEPCTIAAGETRYLSSEVAGTFTGVYFGMYATGNGQRSTTPAFFDWFDYHAENESV